MGERRKRGKKIGGKERIKGKEGEGKKKKKEGRVRVRDVVRERV